MIINNSTLAGVSSDGDSRPRGDGADTQNYIEITGLVIQEIEAFLEKKYNCFKSRLATESQRKYEDEPQFEDDSVLSLNLPFFGMQVGPGRIGSYANSNKKRGYVGNSNLYIGMPDREAEELSSRLEQIIVQEEEEYKKKLNNCEI